jgi:hypothetical protein
MALRSYRQSVPNEKEVLQALADLPTDDFEQKGDCPNTVQLRAFAVGESLKDRVERIAEHLAYCDACLGRMKEIRAELPSKTFWPILFRNRAAFLLACIVLLAFGFWWGIQHRAVSMVATVNLEQVTRGEDDSLVHVNRNTHSLRLILPAGSVAGQYEVAIFSSSNTNSPLLFNSESTFFEGRTLTLTMPIDVAGFKPGLYLLGVRHEGAASWAKYSVAIDSLH